jgi:hypothetical protein
MIDLVFIELFVQRTTVATPTRECREDGEQDDRGDDHGNDGACTCVWVCARVPTCGNGERTTGRLPRAHVRPCAAPGVVVPVCRLWTERHVAVARWTPGQCERV